MASKTYGPGVALQTPKIIIRPLTTLVDHQKSTRISLLRKAS